MKPSIIVATAGWSIPAASCADFLAQGSHLERYSRILSGVEINSTFYRPHQPKTFERWAASTPADFRFAVKAPREITHERRLSGAGEPLKKFIGETAHLGSKLGPMLVQLPPSLVFSEKSSVRFFDLLRKEFRGDVALEPRHASWFTTKVNAILKKLKIARVKADPAKPPEAVESGGANGLVYYRLHGSPRIYWSDYPMDYLERISNDLAVHREHGARVWCVFDNTAQGFAARNALTMQRLLEK
jgi:uncharacterized protein YecE (DUF72 family)